MVIQSSMRCTEWDYVLLTLQQKSIAIYIFHMSWFGGGVYFSKTRGKFWKRREALVNVPRALAMPHDISTRCFTHLHSHTHITHKQARALGTNKLGLKKWKQASSPRDARVLYMPMVSVDLCMGRIPRWMFFTRDSSAENSSSHQTLGNTVFHYRWFQVHLSVFKFF